MVSQEPNNPPDVSLQYVNENCWRRPFVQELIMTSCNRLTDETRSRQALAITNCHLEASDMEGIECDAGEEIQQCRRRIGRHPVAFQTYTTCYYGIDSMCYFMLRDKFQHSTEEAINGLYTASKHSVDSLRGQRESVGELAAEEQRRFSSLSGMMDKTEELSAALSKALMDARMQSSRQLEELGESQSAQQTAQQQRTQEALAGLHGEQATLEKTQQSQQKSTLQTVPQVEGLVLELGATLGQLGGLRQAVRALHSDVGALQPTDPWSYPAVWFYPLTAVAQLGLSRCRMQTLALAVTGFFAEHLILNMAGSAVAMLTSLWTEFKSRGGIFLAAILPSVVLSRDQRLLQWLRDNTHVADSYVGARLFNELEFLVDGSPSDADSGDRAALLMAIFRCIYLLCVLVMVGRVYIGGMRGGMRGKSESTIQGDGDKVPEEGKVQEFIKQQVQEQVQQQWQQQQEGHMQKALRHCFDGQVVQQSVQSAISHSNSSMSYPPMPVLPYTNTHQERVIEVLSDNEMQHKYSPKVASKPTDIPETTPLNVKTKSVYTHAKEAYKPSPVASLSLHKPTKPTDHANMYKRVTRSQSALREQYNNEPQKHAAQPVGDEVKNDSTQHSTHQSTQQSTQQGTEHTLDTHTPKKSQKSYKQGYKQANKRTVDPDTDVLSVVEGAPAKKQRTSAMVEDEHD